MPLCGNLLAEINALALRHRAMELRKAKNLHIAKDFERFEAEYARLRRLAASGEEFDREYLRCLKKGSENHPAGDELERPVVEGLVEIALDDETIRKLAYAKALAKLTGQAEEEILRHFLTPPTRDEPTVIGAMIRHPRYRAIAPAPVDELVSWYRSDSAAPSTASWLATTLPQPVHFFGHAFHPVGQGLFSSGYVTTSRGRFDWVYDCGSADGKAIVAPAIRVYAAEVQRDKGGRRPRLDLVALSHFDNDHVSGLVDLLQRFDVGILMLPYLTFAQRMEVALSEGVSATHNLFQLLVSPSAFVNGAGGGEVRILLVPPSGDGEPAAPIDADGAGGSDIDITSLPSYQTIELADLPGGADPQLGDPRVEILKPGSTLAIPGVWEFLPYNDSNHAWRANKDFATVIDVVLERMKRHSGARDWASCDDDLTLLKEAYDNAFGRRPWMRNVISLFLYSGPTRDLAHATCLKWRPRRAADRLRLSSKTGKLAALLTGDGYLHTKKRLKDFECFFGQDGRLGRSGIFQVMHHGSKYNWRNGVARAVAPIASIFSADQKRYGHPDDVVWDDFRPWNPILVGKRRGWRVDGLLLRE